MKILCLFSETFSNGGIQKVNRYLLKALKAGPQHNDCVVITLNDRSVPAIYSTRPGIKFYCCGHRIRALKYLKFLVFLITNAASWRPSIIVATHISLSPFCSLIKTVLSIRYVFFIHGIEGWNIKRKSFILGIKNADKVVSVSSFTENKLLEQGVVNKTNSVVLNNPVDESVFKIKPVNKDLLERFALKDMRIILTVSRLSKQEEEKGAGRLMNVVNNIKKQIPNVRLLIAGNGDGINGLKTKAKMLELEKEIIFADFSFNEEILADIYNLCEVFILPSKKEGFGLVFTEAAACGKPVIGGNKDGSVDAILNGKIGILVDPDNEEEIRAAILSVLNRTCRKELLSPDYLRQQVVDNFSLSKYSEKLTALLSGIK